MASMLYVFVLCFLCTSHLVQAKGCHSGLGMQDGSISDKQLSVSSAVNDLVSARKGRLYSESGYGAWCPLQKDWYAPGAQGPFYDQYYQVSFSRPVRIIAVGTQGRAKNFGMEGVDNFFVKYSVMQKNWKEYHEWGQQQPKRFFGNKYKMNVTKMNYFKPPFIADTFRLIPEIYPVNQVCLRMELYGCHLQQDMISYTMKPGDIYGSRYNLTDLIFDGIVNSTIMYSGMGFLNDGVLASKDFLEYEGYGWIGWYSGHTPSPYIAFTFFKQRVFRSLTFHCNVRDRSGIKLFKSVKVSFSAEDQSSHGFVVHHTNQASSGYKWMNYNVTVDLCENYGNQVKVEFKYDGEWILISEIMFDSNPLPKGIFPPTPKCKPTTQPPITDELLVNTTTTSNISVITSKDGRVTGDGLDDGAIVGIVCGVLFVVLLVVVFLCYWCLCRRTQNQRKPSFYHFIRWELKPYNSYRDTVRISRLGSNGEKTSTFRRDQNGETQNPESAIYASIKNLEEIGLVPDNTVIQAKKPGKPKNRPPPLPVNAFPHKNDEHYALPDSPLIPEQPAMDEDGYCSPEPQSPLISPPISPIPQIPSASPTTPDVCYAEPEAPRPQTEGYSEPIDAVIPGDGIFRNPVYEEIYSEPYQGVSGSTLYATPSTVVRHETFKDLPRDKIVFKEKIGDGQFGEVHLGEVDGGLLDEDTTKQVLVAIKKLKPEVDKNIKDDFFKEVKIMSGIQHENVIRLLGVCRDDPMCMVVEYMVNGDLNQFLKERELSPGTKGNKEKVLTYQALIYMASQVAAGMKYISSLKFVHRDLATRNCLVGHSYTVKIADFGMSRHLYTKHYYRVHGRVILPIRWMAPECILQGKFTSESDVWAFAVTLWEILTLATEYPYNDLTDEQVIENIQRMFFRPSCPKIVYLSKPSVCPDDVYDMMKACWQRDPDARPDFNDLHGFVKSKVRMSEMAI